MTPNKVIEYVDGVKPNVYTDDDKYTWINKLEGIISTEVHDMAEPVNYDMPADADKELLVPSPYDEVYALYIFAMIDFHNREYNNYNNSATMFSDTMEAYKKYYIQRHAHGTARNFRNVMG